MLAVRTCLWSETQLSTLIAFSFLQTVVELLTLSRLVTVSDVDVGFDASNGVGVSIGVGLGESFIETFFGLPAKPFSTGLRKLDFRTSGFSGTVPVPELRLNDFSSAPFGVDKFSSVLSTI